mgnify:CR=1 FL=1
MVRPMTLLLAVPFCIEEPLSRKCLSGRGGLGLEVAAADDALPAVRLSVAGETGGLGRVINWGDTVTPMDDSAFQQQGGGKGKASSSGKGPSDAASGSPGGKGGKSSPVPAGGPKGGSTKGGSSSQAKGGGGPGGLRKGPGDPVTASSNPPQQQAFQGFPPGAAAPSMSDTASNGGDFATPRSTSGHHSTGEWTARTGGNTAQNTAQNTGNQNQQYTAAEWAAWMGK